MDSIMKHIFYNNTHLELDFLHVHGLSVKTEDAIGQFGTGLKYAIAIVLRNGGTIELCTGGNTYHFGIKEREVRGQKHNRVTMITYGDKDDRATLLPFTTHLGEHWEPWMAFRELYSNARDEHGGYTHGKTREVNTDDYETVFTVECAVFDEVARNIDTYFMMEPPSAKPLIEGKDVVVYENHDMLKGQQGRVFYKGVRVGDGFGYTYVLLGEAWRHHLSEDRVLGWGGRYDIGNKTCKLFNESDMSVRFINYCIGVSLSAEEGIPWGVNVRHHDAFVSAYLEGKLENCPQGRAIAEEVLAEKPVEPRDLTDQELRTIMRAKHHVKKMGIDLSEYKIVLFTSSSVELHGMVKKANRDTIYITQSALEVGLVETIKVLVEEYIHSRYSVDDTTRAFQEAFHKEFVHMYCHLSGEVL